MEASMTGTPSRTRVRKPLATLGKLAAGALVGLGTGVRLCADRVRRVRPHADRRGGSHADRGRRGGDGLALGAGARRAAGAGDRRHARWFQPPARSFSA